MAEGRFPTNPPRSPDAETDFGRQPPPGRQRSSGLLCRQFVQLYLRLLPLLDHLLFLILRLVLLAAFVAHRASPFFFVPFPLRLVSTIVPFPNCVHRPVRGPTLLPPRRITFTRSWTGLRRHRAPTAGRCVSSADDCDDPGHFSRAIDATRCSIGDSRLRDRPSCLGSAAGWSPGEGQAASG